MRRPKRQKGMALLVVLVIVALLTALVTELAFSTLVDLRLTETFRDTTRAYYLAKGGINAGRMILQEDRNGYDALDEPWSQGVSGYPVADGSVTVRITDQDGRLAINAMVRDNTPRALMVDRCFRLFSVLDLASPADPAELTAALIDWLDSGAEPYPMIRTDGAEIPVAGAEASYYQGLPQPYPASNGPLESLEELALVKGFTAEVLARIEPFVSLHDDVGVNVNTAPLELLMALDPSIDRDVAETIVAYRRETPIEDIGQLEGLLATVPYSALKTLANLKQLTTTSRRYRIEADAVVNDGRRRLLAEVDKARNELLFFKVN